MKGNGRIRDEYIEVNTKILVPHPIAQRDFVQKHGDNLAKNFSWAQYKPIDVSYRNGKYYVINGQHRLYAIKKIAGKDTNILCRVYYGMTELDEAEFFLKKGDIERGLNTADKMRVEFRIGNEDIVRMVRGAEQAGWRVDFVDKTQDGRIKAVSALKKCFDALPFDQYVDMLRTIKAIWGGESKSVSNVILLGFALFFQTYAGRFSSLDLIDKLRSIPVTTIIRDGTAMKTTAGNTTTYLGGGKPYARAILAKYNKGRRSKRLEDIL